MYSEQVLRIWKDMAAIKAKAPLVHNITNYVVMNTTANGLLALGASPIMAHALEEIEEMEGMADVLVINIGTLSDAWIESMHKAVRKAVERGIPIIIDPVGAGATKLRTKTAMRLVDEAKNMIVRGNGSEIMALGGAGATAKGVDSLHDAEAALDSAMALSKKSGAVVCISGATDYIVAGNSVHKVFNGHSIMRKVTGTGCMATAITGAFAAVNPSLEDAAFHASAVMGITAELAVINSYGPGTFQVNFLDSIHNLKKEDIAEKLRVEY